MPHSAQVGQPQRVERLAQVEVGLARGDEADPRPPGARAGDRVQPAAADVLERDRQPGDLLAAFEFGQLGAEQLRARAVTVGDEPAGHPVAQVGRLPGHVGQVGGGGAVGDGGGDLDRRPQAAGPRQLDRVQPVQQDLGRVGRVERRQAEVGQREFGRAGHGGGLGGRVVAHQRDRAAGRRGPDQVGVPQRVGGPVEPGRLPVPDAGHAVVERVADPARLARPAEQLGARYRGRGQLLVHPRLMGDPVLPQQGGLPGQLQVVAGQRRSLVAGHVGGRPQARPLVVPGPVEQHPDQRLDPGEEDGAVLALIALVQRGDLQSRHSANLRVVVARYRSLAVAVP